MKSLLILSALVFGLIATVGVLTESAVLLTVGAGGFTVSLKVSNNAEESD